MKAAMRNLMLAALAAVAVSVALPVRATSYIKDVMVIGGTKDEVNSLKSSLTAQGWQVIDYDLNKGAGGDYIYLLYKSEERKDGHNNGFVTDFFINNSSEYTDEDTYNGRTYHLVPYDGGTHFKNVKGDLNSNAGGADIHLYYTKDVFPDKRAVTDITFNTTSTGGVGTKDSNEGYDLNRYANGNYIYMHFTTAAVVIGSLTLQDGDILKEGTCGPDTHVTIAANATVTLHDVDITAISNDDNHKWAGISCEGDATIILQGNNVVKGGFKTCPGIHVQPGCTLVIQGNGKLTARSNGQGSGIGGDVDGYGCGTVRIEGGDIEAIGGESCAGIGSSAEGICDDIIIAGGKIKAQGGQGGAGIGAGQLGTCYNITINNGTVTATGGLNGAGIGCGEGDDSMTSNCGDITIMGGTVEATGGENGAGIGTGWMGFCQGIAISGGTVKAQGGANGAGIGSGSSEDWMPSNCGDITIMGGTVEATGGENSAGIGSGFQGDYCSIVIGEDVASVTATHGDNCDNAIGAGLCSYCSPVTVAEELIDVTEGNTRTITNPSPPTPDNAYTVWAAANNVTGAWDAKDALGIHNVFRYGFGLPTGAFANPPLLAITIDAEGRAVIHTPPLSVTATGFDLSILATDDLAGTGATVYPLDPSGKTVIPKTDSKTRFFRLKAAEK